MTTNTRINITATDSTAGAFNSAKSGLEGVGAGALKATAALAGIGISIAGVVEGIKSVAQATIQFQQFTNTLQVGAGSAKGAADALSFVRAESQRLGLDLATAADQFAKLSAASKGTALQGQATRDIFTSITQAATALGLSADQTSGSLLAIQQIISKGTVSAEELRGQLGERLPGAFQLAARAIGVTTQELDKLLRTGQLTAEDLLPKLSIELNKTFGSQAEQAAQGLTAQMNRMNTALFNLKIAIGESGLINFLSSAIELGTKLANVLTGVFGGGSKLDPIEKQISLINDLEDQLAHMQGINNIIPISDFIYSKKDSDLIRSRIELAKEDLEKLKLEAAKPVPDEQIKYAAAAPEIKKATDGLKELNKAQDFAIAREHEYIKLLGIEKKQREDILKPFADGAQKSKDQLNALEDEISALQFAKDNQVSLQVAVQETTLARLEESKAAQQDPKIIEQIESEIEARRKIADLIPIEEDLRKQTAQTTDQVSELWKQAGRNIQSTLSNSIFDFFSTGLKGMLANVKNTVLRIASEFAGLKLAQGLGLAGIFSAGSALASGGSGAAGGGGSLLNLASAGSSIYDAFKFGGGISQGVTSLFGGATGTQLAAQQGATALWGASGGATGAMSSLGSTMGAAAGPLIAVAVADQVARLIAGDKTLGGTAGKILNYVPVIGPLINGLFGRGPLKQKETSLTADISSGGLESGSLRTAFKAKGGLFRSDKNDFAAVDLITGLASTDNNKALGGVALGMVKYARQVAAQIGETVGTVGTTLRGLSDDLDLSVKPLDEFHKSINLVSRSGEALTETQISDEIAAISDEMVKSLLPSVDNFAKAGEISIQTIARLGAEFSGLEGAITNLGYSASDSRAFVKTLGIELRSSLVEGYGGLDALSAKTQFFYDNFISADQKLAFATGTLSKGLTDLGLSANLSKTDFANLVKSISTTNEMRNALLDLAPLFVTVRSATGDLVDSERDLLSIRQDLSSAYQSESANLKDTIARFTDFAGKLNTFSDSLSLGQLSPLTPSQKLDEARNQFNLTSAAAINGDQSALDKLPQVAQDFLSASQVYNASGAAYLSDFDLVQSTLKNAESSALNQVDLAQSQLDKLDDSVKNLIEINTASKTTNDLLRELTIATLNGSGNAAISTSDIQGYLAANPGLTSSQIASAATQYGVSSAQLSAAGVNLAGINQSLSGATVTDSQINDFVNANIDNPMAIYNAAIANGVSSQRLASVSGIALADIQKFVQDNNLPSFAKGTDFISRSGLAMVHRAEAIVPSSTTGEIKLLREELAKLRAEQNKQTGDMIKVTDITNKQNAATIAKALEAAEKNRAWNNRSRAALS